MGGKISTSRRRAPEVQVASIGHAEESNVMKNRTEPAPVGSSVVFSQEPKEEGNGASHEQKVRNFDNRTPAENSASNEKIQFCLNDPTDSEKKSVFDQKNFDERIALLEQENCRLKILLKKHLEEMDNTDSNFFTEEMDDEEAIKVLFDKISSESPFITLDTLLAAKSDQYFTTKYVNNASSSVEWECLLNEIEVKLRSKQTPYQLSLDEFICCVRKVVPSVPGRLFWTGTIGLTNALARHLKAGTIFDGQQGIKEMDADQIAAACQRFAREVPALVLRAWQALRDDQLPPADKANSKFAMTEGAFTGCFATLDDFYGGVEYKLGQPNPKLWDAMAKEHCVRPNAESMFLAPNYGLFTKPLWEWVWTDNPDDPDHRANLCSRLPPPGQPYPGESGDELIETVLHFSLRMSAQEVCELQPCAAGEGEVAEFRVGTGKADEGRKASSSSALGLDSTTAGAPTWAARAVIALRGLVGKLGNGQIGILDSPEQLARGVVVVLAPKASSVGVTMSIVLPCNEKIALTKVKQVAQVVLEICLAAGIEGVQFAVETVRERRWVYCDHYNEASLRRATSMLSTAALGSFVIQLLPPLVRDDVLRQSLTTEDAIVQEFQKQTQTWALENKLRRQGRRREGGILTIMCLNHVASIVKKSNLRKEECMALRLYTGPLYVLYNALMRNFPKHVVEGLAGNKYETTMFVIVSGITKLSKHTVVPPRGLLYRGLGGMLLPEQFWKKTQQGFLGGVELGLMSTTADRNVAIQYSGLEHHRPMVLEIQAGRIDIGASLEFISQYSGESEFLMQPLSCLEVMGRPRIDRTARGDVLVVPLRVNVNLKSVTVEELEGRRKILHLAMAKNLREELALEALEKTDNFGIQMQEQRRGLMRVLKGSSESTLDDKSCTVLLKEKTVIGAEYALHTCGRGYFEIEIVSFANPNSFICVGMVGSNFAHMPHQVDDDMLIVGRHESTFGVFVFHDDESSLCFRLNGYNEQRDGMPTHWGRDWEPGDVVGVAFDLERGSLYISINGDFGPPVGEAFANMRPGLAVGAGLYPVVAGDDVEFRYNLGGDPSRPMHFRPLEENWQPTALRLAGDEVDLAELGLTSDQLVDVFQSVFVSHEEEPPTRFNEDLVYKGLVNEVLDLKVRLLAKQRAIIDMASEGASVLKLRACAAAAFDDFGGFSLEQECPYRWRDVFEDFFRFKSLVEIPLNLASCQISLVWEAAFATADSRQGSEVKVKLGSEIFDLSHISRELCLVDRRLQYAKFGAAVVGLVRTNKHLEVIDMVGNDFDKKFSMMLIDVVAERHSIVCINGLEIVNVDPTVRVEMRKAVTSGCCLPIPSFNNIYFSGGDESKNLNLCVGFKSPDNHRGSLGHFLDSPSWAFVFARLRELEYKTLILKDNDVPPEAFGIFAWGLRFLPSLRLLDLSENSLHSEGATALAGALSFLTSLTSLDVRNSKLSTSGWKVILPALQSCSLQTLNGIPIDWYRGLEQTGLLSLSLSPKDDDGIPKDSGANALGEDGIEICCQLSIEHNSSLTLLDLSGCVLGAGEGLTALATRLPALYLLRELKLGYCSIGSSRGSGISALAAGLIHLSRLEVLELQAIPLWDQGASHIGGSLSALTCLKELYLEYNFISFGGAEALAAGLSGLQLLEILDLDGNTMGIKGCSAIVDAVAGLSALRKLDVQRNDVLSDDWKYLKQRLSHLHDLELMLTDDFVQSM